MFKGALKDTVPISFYGKVIDTSGTPLKGVDVQLRFYTVNWMFIFGDDDSRKEVHLDLKTDANGEFKLEGLHGSAIIIDKWTFPGYIFKPRIKDNAYDTGYYYAGGGVGREGPYKPDPNKPAIFEMAPINGR